MVKKGSWGMNHFSYTAVVDWDKSVNYNNIKGQKN